MKRMMKTPILISRVKEVMERTGDTYATVMQKTGLSMDTVARARDHRINDCRISTLACIAGALNVRVKDLFMETDEEVPETLEEQQS